MLYSLQGNGVTSEYSCNVLNVVRILIGSEKDSERKVGDKLFDFTSGSLRKPYLLLTCLIKEA